MQNNNEISNVMDVLRSSWFLIVFIGGMIYWVARQDSSVSNFQKAESRITTLENRTSLLESGIGQLQLKIDGIKEDLNLIKSAVIK